MMKNVFALMLHSRPDAINGVLLAQKHWALVVQALDYKLFHYKVKWNGR